MNLAKLNPQRLRLRLPGYLIRFATSALVPHCQIRSRVDAFALVSLERIIAFYRYPINTYTSSGLKSQYFLQF